MWQLKTAYIYHLIFSLSQESRHDLAGFSISGSLFRAAIKELAKTRVSSEGNLAYTIFSTEVDHNNHFRLFNQPNIDSIVTVFGDI